MTTKRFLLVAGAILIALLLMVFADTQKPCLMDDGSPCRYGGPGASRGSIMVPRQPEKSN
jgi:hypothetical protein